jgi:hypothetical protein
MDTDLGEIGDLNEEEVEEEGDKFRKDRDAARWKAEDAQKDHRDAKEELTDDVGQLPDNTQETLLATCFFRSAAEEDEGNILSLLSLLSQTMVDRKDSGCASEKEAADEEGVVDDARLRAAVSSSRSLPPPEDYSCFLYSLPQPSPLLFPLLLLLLNLQL